MRSTQSRAAVAELLSGLVLAAPAWTLDRVNLHVTGSGSPFPLIFKVGIENGYYKDEGLEVLPITAQLLTGIQGVVAGQLRFQSNTRPRLRGDLARRSAENRDGFRYSAAMVALRAEAVQERAGPQGRQASGCRKFRRPHDHCAGAYDSQRYSYLRARQRNAAEEYFHAVCDQFDTLYREAAQSGRVMALPLHPFIMGLPFRIKYLDKVLEHICAHERVWLATGAEIAGWYYQHYYSPA